jgi:hypothetical protein
MANDRFKPGSRPPFLNFSEAMSLATGIYEQGGGRASKDLLSRLTGNTSSSSSFTKKINSLKSYGFVTEENGEIVLTGTGTAAVAPTEPREAAASRKALFQQIGVFDRIYERHKGKILPADEFLKNTLEQEYGIPRELIGDWITSLKNGLRGAGLLHDRGDGKWQVMESPIIRFPRTEEPKPQPHETPVTKEPEQLPAQMLTIASGHTSRIELSGKRFASFSIPDVLTPGDAKKLKAAISGLTSIIDSMVQEDVVG